MSRLTQALRSGAGPRLVTYATIGDPTLDQSVDVLRAMAAGGADVLEIGVPFSDPIADGPVIQRATERALAGGTTLRAALDAVGRVRAELAPPVVLFTYVNPILRLGTSEFLSRAADAGIDGVLLLDLPIEEAERMHAALDERGIDQILLVSPTTTDARLAAAGRIGRGFVYAISRLGVTGARDAVADTARPLVERVRRAVTLPVALGFGISRPEHVRDVTAFADAAVVGSAVVNVIAKAAQVGRPPAREVERFVAWLRGAVESA